MGFNSAFKGLKTKLISDLIFDLQDQYFY